MFKKIHLLLILTILVTLFVQPLNSMAHSIAIKPLTVQTKKTTSSITLSWSQLGSHYKVFKEGRLIGETKKNTFIDNGVKPDELVKYFIAAFDGDKLIETVRISTKAQSDIRETLISGTRTAPDMTTESVASSNYIVLSWPEIPDDDSIYEIYRDGKFIANISGRNFVDSDLAPNTTYRYSIIGTKKLSENEINAIKEEMDKNGLSYEELDELEHTYESIKFVKTLDNDPEKNLENAPLNEANLITTNSTSPPYFSFRYLTFIPDYRVDNPIPGGGNTYFLGNNRNFNVLAFNNSKTEQNIDIEFDQPNNSTYGHRVRNDSTTLVDENNNVIETRTANCTTSNGGFDLFLYNPHSFGANAKKFGAGTDCGIPFGPSFAPNINYGYDGWIERDGDWRVAGSHDQAPSHELYIYKRSTSSYTTIFQTSAKRKSNGKVDFDYLWPFMPNKHFDISG
ncbi:hypothetical protein ACFOQM_02175 [Paenibacillus sp. GCM10012307]|uniref:Fibronectin type-III domain-containing protein n=1 Tax=Paenibacillus roseus TaxID=2798579 RepID=A0A934J223_9BACL|nr:hypothetical protein [Paenibacillus roseus]MBJ6360124.1 hypothetical protein [Paenibacillus roseus]